MSSTWLSSEMLKVIGIDHNLVYAVVVGPAIRHSTRGASRCVAAPAGMSAVPDSSTNHDSADNISGQFLFYHDHQVKKKYWKVKWLHRLRFHAYLIRWILIMWEGNKKIILKIPCTYEFRSVTQLMEAAHMRLKALALCLSNVGYFSMDGPSYKHELTLIPIWS